MKYIRRHGILIGILICATILYLWQINHIPAGLYWDEMDVGYQAYSLLHTGKDYFGNFLPITPHSFADYRAPLYIWATIPSVAIFGLNAFSVRFPAAIFGLIVVFMTYCLVSVLFENKRQALIAAGIIAFCPWLIQYSRMAFEASCMLACLMVGVYGFIRGTTKTRWLLVSAVGFGLTPYAYNTAKLFVPLIFCLLLWHYWPVVKKWQLREVWVILLIAALFAIPLVYSNIGKNANLRLSQITIFNHPNLALERKLDKQTALVNIKDAGWLNPATRAITTIFTTKQAWYLDKLTANYLTSFSTDFLFLTGDPNPRHSPSKGSYGELQPIISIGLLLSIIVIASLWQKRRAALLLLLSWLCVAPLAGAVTEDGGNHATRLILMLPPLVILASMGFNWIIERMVRYKWAVIGLVLFLWLYQTGSFVWYYFSTYQDESARAFQYDLDRVMDITVTKHAEYPTIVIDDYKDSALLAYLFYTTVDPNKFQRMNPLPLSNFVEGIRGFKIDDIYFLPPGERSWRDTLRDQKISGKTLLIVGAGQLKDSEENVKATLPTYATVKDIIRFPDNEPAFYMISLEP